MPPLQGKPGLASVIEIGRIERPEIGIHAPVLHVAAGTVAGHRPMHALLQSHPIGDRLVARQAKVRRDLPVRSMAALARARAFEARMSLGQGAWGLLAGLREASQSHRQQHGHARRSNAER